MATNAYEGSEALPLLSSVSVNEDIDLKAEHNVNFLLQNCVPLLKVHLLIVGAFDTSGTLKRRPLNIVVFILYWVVLALAVPGIVFFRFDVCSNGCVIRAWNAEDYSLVVLLAITVMVWPFMWFKLSQRALLVHIRDVLQAASNEGVPQK